MYLFLPYCVRKWHNKAVQSINVYLNIQLINPEIVFKIDTFEITTTTGGNKLKTCVNNTTVS